MEQTNSTKPSQRQGNFHRRTPRTTRPRYHPSPYPMTSPAMPLSLKEITAINMSLNRPTEFLRAQCTREESTRVFADIPKVPKEEEHGEFDIPIHTQATERGTTKTNKNEANDQSESQDLALEIYQTTLYLLHDDDDNDE